jgi:branched-chain amino acid transport system ATP-binding protein
MLLVVEKLGKAFGGLWAVKDYRLTLPEGKIYGLIGPNGAGKTTIFNLLTGIWSLDEGKVVFNGEDITGLGPHKVAERGIARTFQNLRLFKDLTVAVNAKIARHRHLNYGFAQTILSTKRFMQQEEELDKFTAQLLDMFGLTPFKDRKASSLPYGYQRRLELVRAIAMGPRLVLIDEPTSGMNPKESQELADLVRETKEKFSLTVMIVEHRMPFIMGLCERIQVLDHGVLIAEGSPQEVRDNPDVVEAYLGEMNLAAQS